MSQFEVTGVEEVIRNIRRFGEQGKKAAKKGVDQFSLMIHAKSDEIIPFDSGDLQKKKIDKWEGDKKVIGYEGPYAAKQHEDTTLTHPGPQSKNPQRGAKGQAKYLENPVKQNFHKLPEYIARQIKKII